MAAPTFIASYSLAFDSSSSPRTVTVTTQAGDAIIVSMMAEDTIASASISGNGITFTQRYTTTGAPLGALWTGVDATGGTNWTLTVANSSAPYYWGVAVYIFRNHNGFGAVSTGNGSSGGASLTTTGTNSAVISSVVSSGSSSVWRTVNGVTPTNGNGLERVYTTNFGTYAAASAYYNDTGTAGAITPGLTAASGGTSYAIEILAAAPATPKLSALTDDFNDNSIDPAKWTTGISAGASLAETGGQLVFTPSTTSSGYSYVDSVNTYDFTDSSLTVEFAGTISTAVGAEQFMMVMVDFNNYVMLFIGNTGVGMRMIVGAADDSTYDTRNDAAMRWMRLRESQGTVYWECSPDRANWTVLRSAPTPFSMQSVSTRFSVGSWQTVANPGVAKFDNINLESDIYRNTAEGQSNGTTLTAANSGGGSGDAYGVVTTSGTMAATYSTDMSMFGSQSYKVVSGSSSGLYVRAQATGSYSGSCQVYVYLPTYANNNQLFMGLATSTGSYPARISIDQTGTVRISNYASSVVHTSSSGTIPTGQWIRLDLSAIVGSTTSNGRILAQASYANSFTPFWTYDSGATTNTGTSLITEYRFGKLDTTPDIPLFYFDNSAWRPSMTAFIPPQSSSPSVGWFVA